MPERSIGTGLATAAPVTSADGLRVRAAKAREVALASRKRAPNSYLLDLAARYDAEADIMDRTAARKKRL